MTLLEKLLAHPQRFSFFQAILLLEGSRKGAVPLGHQGPPAEEAVRLRSDTSLGFPKSDVAAVEEVATDHAPPYRLTATFLGLYGTTSPLPNFYSESIIMDEQEAGPLRAFFDLFNHRFLSLFFRSWTKYRPHVLFRSEGKDEFSERLFALAGMDSAGIKASARFPAVRALRFLGLLSQKPHSGESLAEIVRGYFHLPAEVKQFVRSRIALEDEQKAKLGKQNCRLGENLALGELVPDRMGKFQISVGPVGFDDYLTFLPGRVNLEALKGLARLFAPDWLDFDLQVTLKGEETPRLGVALSSDSYLGWTTGLFYRPGKDVAVVFS
ncbi:MAG: type VI secretion system baseplate subunit TssG [candidate division Zixibacteria bacterium]|nr:type VI secretion system baseplate subunit TssG [candidate division Zixibacteria bacterium]